MTLEVCGTNQNLFDSCSTPVLKWTVWRPPTRHTVARLLPGMPEGEDGRPLERKRQERRQAQEEANRLWAVLEAERSKGFWRRLFGR